MAEILTLPSFDRELKRLSKKYASMRKDFAELVKALRENPTMGTPLGNHVYKIRIAISSKNKGKSGGARVITYFLVDGQELYLLSIYDKSEQADISDQLLQQLIASVLGENDG